MAELIYNANYVAALESVLALLTAERAKNATARHWQARTMLPGLDLAISLLTAQITQAKAILHKKL